jgi:hypothetical protein
LNELNSTTTPTGSMKSSSPVLLLCTAVAPLAVGGGKTARPATEWSGKPALPGYNEFETGPALLGPAIILALATAPV